LKERFSLIDEAMKRLADDAAGVRLVLSDNMCVETLSVCILLIREKAFG
jgi:hypothetical protein